jgi:hypothetical protein
VKNMTCVRRIHKNVEGKVVFINVCRGHGGTALHILILNTTQAVINFCFTRAFKSRVRTSTLNM